MHDMGTKERHQKGDIEEYTPRSSKRKYARTINQLEHYAKLGWIEDKHVKAGSMLYTHWWIGVKGDMPQSFNGMLPHQSVGTGLEEGEKRLYHKDMYMKCIRELFPQEKSAVIDVCVWNNSLGARRSSAKARSFLEGIDTVVKILGY